MKFADLMNNANQLPQRVKAVAIVDGSHMLHRTRFKSFNQDRNTFSYFFTRTLLSSLDDLARENNLIFTKTYVCWDGGLNPKRVAIYPEYKQKEPEPHEAHSLQVYGETRDYLHTVFPGLGLVSLKCEDVEADDIAFHITRKHNDFVLLTEDGDWTLMLRENTTCLHHKPIKEETVKWDDIVNQFGAESPLQIMRALKALVGDTSDNIKGINGIGNVYGLPIAKAMVLGGDVKNLRRGDLLEDEEHYAVYERNHRLVGFDVVLEDTPFFDKLLVEAEREAAKAKNTNWIDFCEEIKSVNLVDWFPLLKKLQPKS